MFDSPKVIIGLVIFVVFVTFPLWWQNIMGSSELPEVAVPEGKCVESGEFMRAKHMDLLNDWRNVVVRDGMRTYVSTDGTEYNMSLTLTCLDCHESQEKFCGECHDFAGVKPLCWECHNKMEDPRMGSADMFEVAPMKATKAPAKPHKPIAKADHGAEPAADEAVEGHAVEPKEEAPVAAEPAPAPAPAKEVH